MQITSSHASRCHYCNVDFVLFHNITCYINFLLSCTYVTATCLLKYQGHFVCYRHDIREVKVYTLNSLMYTSVISLLLQYPETLGNECSHLKSHSLSSYFLPYIMKFGINANHQRSQTTLLHCITCHYWNPCEIYHNGVQCLLTKAPYVVWTLQNVNDFAW